MIDALLNELQTTWNFGPVELADIKQKMAAYAVFACIDSEIRQQACSIDAETEQE